MAESHSGAASRYVEGIMRAVGVAVAGALAALVVLAACSASAVAQAATGLEPGVHVSPGSPAAKEYALPLNQARRTGAPASHEASGEAALFGAGIKPPGSGGSSRPGSRPHNRRAPAPPASAGGDRVAAALPPAVLQASRGQGSSGGGDGSLLALVAGGVAILVLGGFGGTVLRHNRRPTPSA
jgi:hypothetical protein